MVPRRNQTSRLTFGCISVCLFFLFFVVVVSGHLTFQSSSVSNVFNKLPMGEKKSSSQQRDTL